MILGDYGESLRSRLQEYGRGKSEKERAQKEKKNEKEEGGVAEVIESCGTVEWFSDGAGPPARLNSSTGWKRYELAIM